MPTLQIASDLHFELHRDDGASFVEQMDPTGVDILLLAGDILSAQFLDQAKVVFQRLAAKYPQILYVPGNHELWHLKPAEAISTLRHSLAGLRNVAMLDNQLVTVKGRRFLGGPMWVPQWGPQSEYTSTLMSDFTQIVDFHPWLVQENRKFSDFVKQNLKAGDVVLTHYLPSMKSVSPRYKGSSTNPFFVSGMDQLILDRRPALWVHGHTHDSFDYQLSGTRIVCNPFGYPKELNSGYNEKLLIFIE